METKVISIIIPCRNEERYITDCINSVKSFSIPEDVKIEIFVIDGESTDNTKQKVKDLIQEDNRISLINNPGIIQATALNIGIKKARGEYILRLDAHAIYPKNYLSLCYESSLKTNAHNVGGLFITQPGGEGYEAKLIQALTTHKFGVGNAGFRIGMSEGEADTVPYGFYRKEIFHKIGYLDERLVRAQDYEFNRRLIKSGGKIWRDPQIQISYFNQPTLKKFLLKQFTLEAPYNAYMWFLAPYSFAFRHGITGIFSLGVVGGISLSFFSSIIKLLFSSVMFIYLCLAIFSAFQQARKYKNILHFFILPMCFFSYHFIHGIGLLTGILKLLFNLSPVQKLKEPWSGYGSFRVRVKKVL